ncbi:hypothetical protein PMIN03_011654 [Paraphaeosphaeria minitans]
MLEIHRHVGELAHCGAADWLPEVFSLAQIGHHQRNCYLVLGRLAGQPASLSESEVLSDGEREERVASALVASASRSFASPTKGAFTPRVRIPPGAQEQDGILDE